nr:major inner-capsid protein [Pteropine orthoreovirus]
MARAVFDFFTTLFGNRGLPTDQRQLTSLLTSSNSPWQKQYSPLALNLTSSTISTPNQPFPGSAWYQESMLFSALLPPVLVNQDAWRDANYKRFCWTDATLSGLVAAPDPPRAPPYVPVSGAWFDLTQYPRWANRRRELETKYPLLLRITLLNMMQNGPLIYVETWPNMLSGALVNFAMSCYGKDFREIAMVLAQSCSNMPFAPESSYDQQMRVMVSLWILSYIGVVHQNATIAGFFFSTKTRGVRDEAWTLFYNTNGRRLNITQRHFGYFCARSADWNADSSWLAAAQLSALVMSCRQFPLLANQGVVNQAQNRPGYSSPNGVPVRELQLLACATECIRAHVQAGLIDQAKGQTLTQNATDINQILQREIDDIKAADDALYNQNPEYARRIKPFQARSWTVGQSMQSLAALTAFAT